MKNILLIVGVSITVIALFFLFYKKSYRESYTPTKDGQNKIAEIKRKIEGVHPSIKSLKFSENDESYTLNKKHVHLCIRDQNNQFYPDNMLIYVALHEVAHTLSNEIIENKDNHTSSFFSIFSGLLKKAAELGIYDPSIKPVTQYCNV